MSIIDDNVIGPYILLHYLNAESYDDFQKRRLIVDVPLKTLHNILYQHDEYRMFSLVSL